MNVGLRQQVLRHLSFRDLLLLRAVSHAMLSTVLRELSREFDTLLARFFHNPSAFKNTMQLCDVYVVGFHALSFFYRQLYTSQPLELCVPRQMHVAVDELLVLRHNAKRIVQFAPEADGVLSESHYETALGRIILLQSETTDSLYPIFHEATSVRMTYVGARHFGCVWPSLTLNKRGLAGASYYDDSSDATLLHDLGFDIRLFAWQFLDLTPPQLCAWHRYLCPAQPRYLHDDGSLLVSWQPLSDSKFAPCVCFRLDTRPCGGPCLDPHEHLSDDMVLSAEY